MESHCVLQFCAVIAYKMAKEDAHDDTFKAIMHLTLCNMNTGDYLMQT